MNITKLINNFKFETFETDLNKLIKSQLMYAEKYVGEGSYGKVYRQNIGPLIIYKIKDIEHIFKVVIKELKMTNITNFEFFDKKYIEDNINEYINSSNIKNFNKKKYNPINVYSSDKHPNGEYIILSLLSKFWYDGNNPHILFMLSPVSIKYNNRIDGFVIEQCGIDEDINYEIKNIAFPINFKKYTNTKLETLSELIRFSLNICDKDFNVKNIIVGNFNLVDILNEILLSYLFSHQQIQEQTNITLIDLHIENIMIKFIDEYAFSGEHKLLDYDSIHYNINNTIYEIPLRNFIIKFGDVGMSVFKNNKVLIIGDTIDGYEFKKIFTDRMSYFIELFTNLRNMLPTNLYEKTICYDIMKNDFGYYSLYSGIKLDDIKPYELIKKYFNKFITKKYKKPYIVKS
jgi:hypothetical protein